MFDGGLQRFINRPLNAAGKHLARQGVHANALTLSGAIVAIATVAALAGSHFTLALALLALNRLLDGLDGAVARASARTPLGGYLDSVADYIFYSGVPLGFALAAPTVNALPAAALLSSFLLTCASFLAFAAVAAQPGVSMTANRGKAFFYSRGLMEGAETIAFFVLMMLMPGHFAILAWIFAVLCVITAVQRTVVAVIQLRGLRS